jgi:hypothetical protein
MTKKTTPAAVKSRRARKAPDNLVYFPGCGPWSREAVIQPINLLDPLPSFGYKRGVTINATSVKRLCLDDSAALTTSEGMCIGRVFHLDRQGVTLRVEDGGDCYHEWTEIKWAGHIVAAVKGAAKRESVLREVEALRKGGA